MTDDMHCGPCERLIVTEGGIAELVRWQATQNGILLRQGKQVEQLSLDLTEMRGEFKAIANNIKSLADSIQWTRRVMIGTILATVGSIAARSVGLF